MSLFFEIPSTKKPSHDFVHRSCQVITELCYPDSTSTGSPPARFGCQQIRGKKNINAGIITLDESSEKWAPLLAQLSGLTSALHKVGLTFLCARSNLIKTG